MSVRTFVKMSALSGSLLCFAFPGQAAPERPVAVGQQSSEKTLDLSFATPTLVPSAASPGQQVVMSEFPLSLDAGHPALPFRSFRIALKPGTRLENVKLTDLSFGEMSADLALNKPAVPSFPGHSGSWKTTSLPLTNEAFPSSHVRVSVQTLHGVHVACIDVFPAVYNAATHKLSYIEKGRLVLRIQESGIEKSVALRDFQFDEVQQFADNKEELSSWNIGRPQYESADDYDYLIIAADMFKDYSGDHDLKTLVDNLATRGLRARIVSVSEALAAEGNDAPEKIRNTIRAEYRNHGIRYVLLVGDGDKTGSGAMIPARKLWSKIKAFDGQWREIELNIPSDFYYAALDGSFNGNKNDKWGEANDGDNGSDVDMLQDVTVGRMPIEKIEELKNFVSKTLAYQSEPTKKEVLLMGEVLFPAQNLYGGDYMNQLVGRVVDHGYETQGHTPDWNVSTLYDTRTQKWSAREALAKINSGAYSIIHHLGHSNINFNMRMDSTTRAPAFANAKPFFYYTQGCYPGDFTSHDSFIEKMVRHPAGAVAAIANTVYGLGPEDPDPSQTKTPGASQMLHRQFVNAMFGRSVKSFGDAHRMSKEANLGYISSQEMRWVFWEATYFGEPALGVK